MRGLCLLLCLSISGSTTLDAVGRMRILIAVVPESRQLQGSTCMKVSAIIMCLCFSVGYFVVLLFKNGITTTRWVYFANA